MTCPYLLARPRALSEPAPAKAATTLRLGGPALCQHLGSVQLAMPLRCLPYKWQPRCAQNSSALSLIKQVWPFKRGYF